MPKTRANQPGACYSFFSFVQFEKRELTENPICFSLCAKKQTLHVEHAHKAINLWEDAAEASGCESVGREMVLRRDTRASQNPDATPQSRVERGRTEIAAERSAVIS